METVLTERQYRQIALDSYSSIKDFAENRKKYYKKYILKENVEEEEDFALKMGSLVDCIILSINDFEDKFYISATSKTPTGVMLPFCEALYRRTMEVTIGGVVTEGMESIMNKAYNDVKFDKNGVQVAFKRSKADTFEEVVKKFVGSDAEVYYNEIRMVRPNGLCVITNDDMTNAERIKDELMTNPFTQRIIKQQSEDGIVIHKQLPVYCEFMGHQLKGLLDILEINHNEKFIQPWDLKVTWNVEEFYEKYYLYRKTYLQALIYDKGVKAWAAENGLEDYEFRPMKFIVADSINYMSPLVYESTFEDLEAALWGFEHRNRKYEGLNKLLDDLKWHKDTSIWNVSRENWMNNGVCKLKK